MTTARTLYLLRHAKSSWGDPSLRDRDRPLNGRGRRAAPLIATHMRERRIEPNAVIASPAVRAQQTLELIRPALAARTAVWRDSRVYGAGTEELLEVIRELPADFSSALLIGHNPGLQELALMLASEGEQLERIRRKYPTAALATLDFGCEWLELRPGVARLEAFVRPKQLAG